MLTQNGEVRRKELVRQIESSCRSENGIPAAFFLSLAIVINSHTCKRYENLFAWGEDGIERLPSHLFFSPFFIVNHENQYLLFSRRLCQKGDISHMLSLAYTISHANRQVVSGRLREQQHSYSHLTLPTRGLELIERLPARCAESSTRILSQNAALRAKPSHRLIIRKRLTGDRSRTERVQISAHSFIARETAVYGAFVREWISILCEVTWRALPCSVVTS